MRFIAISDTHGKHGQILIPEGDVLIHAGDVCSRGSREEAEAFVKWFSSLPHRYKIFIAGNHDFYFERAAPEEVKKLIPANLIYLNDSGVAIEGIRIWGSPVQPWFMDWAFNRQRGADIRKHWDLIPANTDVLVTHGPVHGILDKTFTGESVGCEDLLHKVLEIKPKVHICGHIHEGYGEVHQHGVHFINASNLNLNYRPVNKAVVFELG